MTAGPSSSIAQSGAQAKSSPTDIATNHIFNSGFGVSIELAMRASPEMLIEVFTDPHHC